METRPERCRLPAVQRIMRSRLLMSLEQAIVETVRELASEDQQEILTHAIRLRDRNENRKTFGV